MPITRRHFITGTLAGVISTLLVHADAVEAALPHSPLAVPPPSALPSYSGKEISLETIHASHFKSCLNTPFQVTGENGAPLSLELIEVAELYASPQMENFSLVFQGPEQTPLAQKIYPFSHGELGEFSIFIVPIGRTERGMRYEAIFNRLI